jgi:hypothetical protein
MLFIIISALHVSGGFSANHQELIKLHVQPWELSCFLLSTAGVDGLEMFSCTVPTHPHQHDSIQGCKYSFISS